MTPERLEEIRGDLADMRRERAAYRGCPLGAVEATLADELLVALETVSAELRQANVDLKVTLEALHERNQSVVDLTADLDTERDRLNWLEEVGIETHRTHKGNGVFCWRDATVGPCNWVARFIGERPNLRAAIDVAREREKGASQ